MYKLKKSDMCLIELGHNLSLIIMVSHRHIHIDNHKNITMVYLFVGIYLSSILHYSLYYLVILHIMICYDNALPPLGFVNREQFMFPS